MAPNQHDKNIDANVAVLQSVVYKIDNTVAEIAKTASELTRLLSVHDARISSLEWGNKETITDVRELYTKMSDNTREIVGKIEDMEDRIEKKIKEHSDQSLNGYTNLNERLTALENWRWMLIGVSIVIGYLLNHLDTSILK